MLESPFFLSSISIQQQYRGPFQFYNSIHLENVEEGSQQWEGFLPHRLHRLHRLPPNYSPGADPSTPCQKLPLLFANLFEAGIVGDSVKAQQRISGKTAKVRSFIVFLTCRVFRISSNTFVGSFTTIRTSGNLGKSFVTARTNSSASKSTHMLF